MQANTMIRRPVLAPATDKINQIPQQECISQYCLSIAVCSPAHAKPYLKENSSTPAMKSTIASPNLCKAEVFKNIAFSEEITRSFCKKEEEEGLPKEELVKKESKRAARCAPKPKPAAPKPAEAKTAVPKAVSTVEVEDGMVVWTLPRRSFVSLEFVEDDVPLVNLDQNLMLDNFGQVHETTSDKSTRPKPACTVEAEDEFMEDDAPLFDLDENLILDNNGEVYETRRVEDDVPLVNLDEDLLLDQDGQVHAASACSEEAAAVGGLGEVEDAMRHAIVPFDKAEPLETSLNYPVLESVIPRNFGGLVPMLQKTPISRQFYNASVYSPSMGISEEAHAEADMTRCCCKAQGTQVSNLETFTLEDEALPKEELVKKESKRAARCAPKPKPAEPKPAAPKPAEATPAVPKAVSTVEVEDGMVVWTLPRRSFVSLEFVEDDVPLVNLDQNLMLDNVGQVHETCLVLCVEDDVSLVNLDEKLVLDKDGGVVEIKEPPQPPQPPQELEELQTPPQELTSKHKGCVVM